MQFRQMKIGKRAASLFTLLGLLVLALGLISLYETRQMDRASSEIRETWLPSVISMGEIGTDLNRARAMTMRSLIEEQPETRADTLRRAAEVNQGSQKAIDLYEGTIFEPEDRALFTTFTSARERYLGIQASVADAVLNNRLDNARQLINGPLGDATDAMQAALRALVKYNADGADKASQRSADASEESFLLIITALVVIMTALIAIATLLTRSIVVPLADAVAVAERVATGDLTRDIHVEGKDEPALLLGALSRMQASLRSTLARISASSDQLASASEELHSVTEDTSRGLQQQSAEIEQAATAVNQMTAAVEEVANNAVSTADASKCAA